MKKKCVNKNKKQGKFQFVWRGFSNVFNWFYEDFHKTDSSLKYIFNWRLMLGLVEIRRWNDERRK